MEKAQITWTNPEAISAQQVSAANVLINYAGDFINSFLARPISWDIKVTIDLNVPTANGKGDEVFFEKIGSKSIFYSVGENESITGKKATGYDAIINTNPIYLTQYYVDPDPTNSSDVPVNAVDSLGMFIHEMLHGLGFNGWTGWTTITNDTNAVSPFDLHIINKNGVPYFSGLNVASVYGGDVPLTIGNLFHIGNKTGAGSELLDDIMNGVVAKRGPWRTISSLDLAILADLGIGTIRSDILTGTDIADNIYAGAGDDTIIGRSGDDKIDGGAGTDTAVYSSTFVNSTITKNADGSTNVSSASDGTDTLYNIEYIKFSDRTVSVKTQSTSILNKSDGGSYLHTYNPSSTVLEVISEYTASNAAGTKISDIVNNTSGTSLLYAYNPTATVKQTAEQYAGGNAGGAKLSTVVNNTDGSSLIYAYNPTSSVSLTAQTWTSTNSADGSPAGSKVSDVVDNTDGTCLVYAYNPSSSVKLTAQKWSGTNSANGAPAGSAVSCVVNNNDGTCIVYAYNPSSQVSQTAEIYSTTNATTGAPSGSLTTRVMNYVKGGSSVTVFGAGGSEKTTNYSGPDGTGGVLPASPGLPPPSSITLADNSASTLAGLDASTPMVVGAPAITTLLTGDPQIINAFLSPSMGVQETANFQYGADELVLALNGSNNMLQAANIMVDSMAAISLYSSADSTHGIILTGLDQGLTTTKLVANHTTFRNGN